MPITEWDDSLALGIEDLDQQHKQLIGYINTIYDAVHSENRQEIILEMIGNLSKYADEHFALEEKYMADSNYPGLDDQKREHKYFIVKLLSLEAEGQESSAAYADVLNFLMSWLVNHVRRTDLLLKTHLRP